MGSQGTPTPPGVDMQAMVEELHASIELATGQGATQARIALRPAELGGIRIHLSQTESGLLVRLTPDSSAGAQALGEAHSELHRSLSSLGVPLLRMDIGSQAQSDARPREDRLAGDGQSSGHGAGAGADTEGEPEPQLLGAEHPVTTLRTLDGRLVDVLA
jgi:flagellar hook-length control protein FliK